MINDHIISLHQYSLSRKYKDKFRYYGTHNINLKKPDFPQTVWLKDNEERGRDIQKVWNYPFVKTVF